MLSKNERVLREFTNLDQIDLLATLQAHCKSFKHCLLKGKTLQVSKYLIFQFLPTFSTGDRVSLNKHKQNHEECTEFKMNKKCT